VVSVLITGVFPDFTGTLHTRFGWLAKIQFIPWNRTFIVPIDARDESSPPV